MDAQDEGAAAAAAAATAPTQEEGLEHLLGSEYDDDVFAGVSAFSRMLAHDLVYAGGEAAAIMDRAVHATRTLPALCVDARANGSADMDVMHARRHALAHYVVCADAPQTPPTLAALAATAAAVLDRAAHECARSGQCSRRVDGSIDLALASATAAAAAADDAGPRHRKRRRRCTCWHSDMLPGQVVTMLLVAERTGVAFTSTTQLVGQRPWSNGTSLLHVACSLNMRALVDALLRVGANANVLALEPVSNQPITPLHEATWPHPVVGDAVVDEYVVKALLLAGADPNGDAHGTGLYISTPLTRICQPTGRPRINMGALRALLAAGARVDIGVTGHTSLLQRAVLCDNAAEAMHALLRSGARARDMTEVTWHRAVGIARARDDELGRELLAALSDSKYARPRRTK